MLETSKRPTFEEVELDDDILTPEEYAEFTSSRYRELTFGFPRGSFSTGQFDGALDFEFHSDSSLGSPRSEDSDSSILSVKTDKSSASGGSGSNSAKKFLRPRIDPLTSEGAKYANSISGLSQLPANSWNKFSHHVFRNFKVKTFIVQPNYFLCASKSTSLSQVEENVKIRSGFTIDRIIEGIHSQGSEFLQWSAIEPDVDRLLTAYEDLKGFPKELSDIEKSTIMLGNFITKLNRIQSQLPGESSLVHVALWLVKFANKLQLAVETQHFKEDLSEEYIMALILYFEDLIGGQVTHRQKESVSLNLKDPITGQGKVMNIQPDVFVYCSCAHFLVGEVKPYRIPKRKEYKPQAESSLDKVLHKTDWGGKVEIPCPTCDSVFLSEEDAKEHFESVQHAKRIKLVDEEIPCTVEYQKEGKESPIKAGGDSNTSDRATKLGEMSNLPCDMSDDAEEEINSKHFRYLKEKEKFMVKRYLPQLLAEMLACMDANTKNINLGRDNERNQLGFAVDGFNLKLVRLVLRNTSKLKGKPTVSNIRNPDVRCDVFMTKNFNLFNKRHLKMLFQILFALLDAFKNV